MDLMALSSPYPAAETALSARFGPLAGTNRKPIVANIEAAAQTPKLQEEQSNPGPNVPTNMPDFLSYFSAAGSLRPPGSGGISMAKLGDFAPPIAAPNPDSDLSAPQGSGECHFGSALHLGVAEPFSVPVSWAAEAFAAVGPGKPAGIEPTRQPPIELPAASDELDPKELEDMLAFVKAMLQPASLDAADVPKGSLELAVAPASLGGVRQPPIVAASDELAGKELEEMLEFWKASLMGEGMADSAADVKGPKNDPSRMPPLVFGPPPASSLASKPAPGSDELSGPELEEMLAWSEKEAIVAKGKFGSADARPDRLPPLEIRPNRDELSAKELEAMFEWVKEQSNLRKPFAMSRIVPAALAVGPQDPVAAGPAGVKPSLAGANSESIIVASTPPSGPVSDPDSTDPWKIAADEAPGPVVADLGADGDAILAPKAEPIGLNGSGKPESTASANEIADRRSVSLREAAAMARHLADRIEALAATGRKEGVTIHLRPDDLGSIILTVRRTGGEVDAQIQASHPGVREALESGRPYLHAVLDQRGFTVGNLSVAEASAYDRPAGNPYEGSHSRQPGTLRHAPQPPALDPYGTPEPGTPAATLRWGGAGVDLWI